MPYYPDPDLEFLGDCNNDDLGVLLDIVRGKEGDLRPMEAITWKDSYRTHYPNHRMYWTEIAEDLQNFGGNSVANNLRGHGVLYSKILSDVCGKLKVPQASSLSVGEQENRLLLSVLNRSVEKMSAEEREKLLEGLKIPSVDLSKQGAMAAIQGAVVAGGFASYQMAVIVANAVALAVAGRGLSLVANAALTRAIGVVAGPIGWLVTGVWAAYDIAGPAFRVTIPACIQVAYMRAKRANKMRLERRISRTRTSQSKAPASSKKTANEKAVKIAPRKPAKPTKNRSVCVSTSTAFPVSYRPVPRLGRSRAGGRTGLPVTC